MQTVKPLWTMWQKLRGYVSPLDGFSAFYLGLESGAAGAHEAELSADALLPVVAAAH